jgi:hypothetical protein
MAPTAPPPATWPAAARALPEPPAHWQAAPAPRGRSPFAVGVGLVGVVALMLVMVFVVRGMNGQGTGASSPEDFVQRLQSAINKEDPAALLALLDPDELPTLGDIFETAVQSVRKTQDIDIDGARAALDLEVRALEYDTTSLGAEGNYAKVTFHSGRADWHTDPGKLPDGIKSKATEGGEELPEPDSGTATVEDLQVQTDDGEMLDPFFVLVKTNGRWYASISMTAGEYAGTVAGLPGGDFDLSDSAPSAASSPEEAVRLFIEGAADSLDSGGKGLDRLTNLLPDGQTRALRVYAKALDRSVDDVAEEEGDDDLPLGVGKVAVDGLKLSSGSSHGQTTVRIDGVDLRWESESQSCFTKIGALDDEYGYGDDYSYGDEYDYGTDSGSDTANEPDSPVSPGFDVEPEPEYQEPDCTTYRDKLELHWDGHCATLSGTSTRDPYSEGYDNESVEPEKGCLNDETGPDELGPADFGITDIHIVVKQERGGWVVDPIATMLDYGRTALEHLDTPKVRRLIGHEI